MGSRVKGWAVFLDRDGVLNRAVVRDGRPYPPHSADQVEILPGVREGLVRLKAAGALLVVVTNQPDVARSTATVASVEAINARLAAELPVDEFRVCVHDEDDDCSCRKPRPGMLVDVAARRHIDLHASVMVGDRWRDVEAGRRAGTATVFIDRGYDERQPEPADLVVSELGEAVDWILERRQEVGRRDSEPRRASGGDLRGRC